MGILRPNMLMLLAVAVSHWSCDKQGSGTAADPSAKPGRLVGKLKDYQGKPLSNVTVSIFGFSEGGEPVTREVKLKGPAGDYDIELPPGKYNTPAARIGVDYNGRWYSLPLAAADGTREWMEQKDSRQGLVRDFVWKISGQKPRGDPLSPEGCWGGAIHFDKEGDLGDSASIEITLKPEGPLMDGSEGKPLIFRRQLPWKRHEDHYLLDIPLGKYTATAKLLYGTRPKTIRLIAYTVDPSNLDQMPTKLVESATVEFECHEPKPGEYKLMIPNLVAFPPR